jgi:hypothetical protein
MVWDAEALEAHLNRGASSILGREVKWSVRGDFPLVLVEQAFRACGFAEPAPPTAVEAAERALEWGRVRKLVTGKANQPLTILRRLDKGGGLGESSWAFVDEKRKLLQTGQGPAERTLDFDHQVTFRLYPAQDRLAATYVGDPVREIGLQKVVDRYGFERQHFSAQDVSGHLKKVLREELDALPLWNEGNDYFVPAVHEGRVLGLRQQMQQLAPRPSVFTAAAIVDEPVSRQDTMEAVQYALADEIKASYDELVDLVQNPKAQIRSFTNRLDKFTALRKKLADNVLTFRFSADEFERALSTMDGLAQQAIAVRTGGVA